MLTCVNSNCDRFLLNLFRNLDSGIKQSFMNIILRIYATDCTLEEMMKLDILVFKSLNYLIENPVVCFILKSLVAGLLYL